MIAAARSIVFDTAAENLGENCKTYNDGVDTFLVGQCNQNYVWYSGKLWRIVLKNNETGAVKMVTDNAMTTISYSSKDNVAYENSYVDQWLTQEFLPTLHDYDDYLVVDNVWDATVDGSCRSYDTVNVFRPVGTTTFTRTVGLLNAYEYDTTYSKSDGLATNKTGYLTNDSVVSWWLMTPTSTSSSSVCDVYYGKLGFWNSTAAYGIRPSINLKSHIKLSGGIGTIDNPYKLEGDGPATGNSLLLTRYSGEYVTFNNELYRIVGVEDGTTKILAIARPKSLMSSRFHTTSLKRFEESSIKADLENYYQNEIVEPYKSMIEPDTVWYLGVVEEGMNYKASICAAVDNSIGTNACEKTSSTATVTVGLPRLGEMFTTTSQKKEQFWTLTPSTPTRLIVGDFVWDNISSVWYSVDTNCLRSGQITTSGYAGARPSFYLKSNVVISSTNTGDGTYEHPYEIALGS